MIFKLKVLGTQSPYSKEGHHCPGFLVWDDDSKIMLDCGSGTHSMLDIPSDLHNLLVILTHLHRDHYNDIYNLEYASYVMRKQGQIEVPLTIFLPKSPPDIVWDIREEVYNFSTFSSISEIFKTDFGRFQIEFCKTDHPVETYAVKLTKDDKKIVYTSDTAFSAKDKLIAFAKGADILICESSLLTSYGFAKNTNHLTAKQAGIIAKEAGVKKLLLTHFWPEELPERYVEEAKTVFKNTFAAQEGEVIEVT